MLIKKEVNVMENKWISVNDKLPENGEDILIAILSAPVNFPASYSVRMSCYKNKNWLDCGSNNSFLEPDYWQPLPIAPEIKYQYSPENCKHEWYENPDNRYCCKCGTTQKEIKKERRWEEMSIL